EPLFKAVAEYRVWLTGLRREQARSRAALEESALFELPGGKQVLKLAPLAEWTTRDVWYVCEELSIPLLPLYARGYTSIGCEPCTSLPLDPSNPRSGRWHGQKLECGITFSRQRSLKATNRNRSRVLATGRIGRRAGSGISLRGEGQDGTFALNFLARAASVVSHWISRL